MRFNEKLYTITANAATGNFAQQTGVGRSAGITDNEAIAARCGCTAAQVKRVREAFEQKR